MILPLLSESSNVKWTKGELKEEKEKKIYYHSFPKWFSDSYLKQGC